MRICEEREARRAKEVEAIRERQQLMLARGGGPALQQSLEEQIRLDEMRMEKTQREVEQKRGVEEAAKLRERKQQAAETRAMLDQQVVKERHIPQYRHCPLNCGGDI